MPLEITTIVFDAGDAPRLAAFWAAALGWTVATPDDDGWVIVKADDGEAPFILLFIPVPEPKSAKNRVHLDLNPVGADHSEELARLLGLGAQRVDIGQDGTRWDVLVDPEGNELCLLHRRLDPVRAR